jgi:hypothetical protein
MCLEKSPKRQSVSRLLACLLHLHERVAAVGFWLQWQGHAALSSKLINKHAREGVFFSHHKRGDLCEI